MLAPRPNRPLTDDEFLALVDARPMEKWELIDGRPVAMAGGTLRHALIGANIAEAIGPVARSKGCRALRDMYFRVAANDGGQVFDPDVMIRCGAGPLEDRMIDDARAVFEVLSPSTMAYDRGAKLQAYLQNKTVEFVALVYPGEWRVETWAREGAGGWPEGPAVLKHRDDTLAVPFLDCALELRVIYEGAEPD